MDLALLLINKFKKEPIADPSIPATTPAPPLTARQNMIEDIRLKNLEPTTQIFVKSILGWARANGIPAILGETHRTQADQDKASKEGKSAIKEGQFGWHQVGRAFHLIIMKDGQLDRDSYRRIGEEVRKRGGDWLGDRVLKTGKGTVEDIAHYEYHPGIKITSYRGSSLAKKELAMAERRKARYGYG